MTHTRIALSWAVVAALALYGGWSMAQDSPKPDGQPKGDEARPEVDESKLPPGLQAWLKYGKPGPMHEKLARFAGKWKSVSSFPVMPGQKAQEATGESEGRMILGGRFLVYEAKGSYGGAPLESYGLMGYDLLRKKFKVVGSDSMSTAMIEAEGDWDEATQSIRMEGEYLDPISGGRITMKFRWVWTLVSETEYRFEMWEVPPPEFGKEYKAMTQVFTRR